MRRALALLPLLTLSACPPPPEMDAGMVVDSGPPPPPCDSPEDCKVVAFDGVCRQGQCTAHVPCADDLECGLAERCSSRECIFTGCVGDADCPTGRCRADTFSCAECAENADCPFNRPICQASTQKCVACRGDADCAPPGPAHCEMVSGQCQHCLIDDHCPNGLRCNGGTCTGAPSGAACPTGTACAEGLSCILLGGNPVCLQGCNAYAPACPTGQICYTLKYSDSISYVFDMGGLSGVCYTPVQNARNYRDSCTKNVMGVSNCQPSLACVPDSPQGSTCRAYCDPGATGSCPTGELCHPYPGDFYGRQYGICYGDNGFGARCTSDAMCRPGQACAPYEDPSSFEELTPACLFSVGASPGLAPCRPQALTDGGMVTADRSCASGSCRGDSFPSTSPYFCYAACSTDSDCSIGTRTGTCDGDYTFVSPTGLTAFIVGCRPGCLSAQTCSEYDGGLTCRARLITGSANSGLKLNCGLPNAGGFGAGSGCTFSGQCRSGFCALDDTRGVRRNGHCLEPCQGSAECAAAVDPDGGGATSGPLDCLSTAFLGNRGPDFRAGTPDDQFSVNRVCMGIACDEDVDCSADGGVRCVPEVSPADAGAFVLGCRPATTGVREAGVACLTDQECASGRCGTLTNNARVCFQACSMTGAACPAGLTCRAGEFHFTSTAGPMVQLDGCAP